ALRRSLGLEQPWPLRSLAWLRGIATGNWGRSLMSSQPVVEIILGALGPTLLLMTTATVVALVVGVAVGVVSAVRQYSWIDYAVTVGAFAGVSLPNFFLALGALYVFFYLLGWFPAAGMQTAAVAATPLDVAHHLVMPALV